VGFVPGIPLLIWGWIIGKRRCPRTSTSGEVFEAGRYKGFRWTDGENTPRLVLLRPKDERELMTGSEVAVHHDICHPALWGVSPPRNDNTALILGWILTTVCILCTVAGFLFKML
jgi:hypothetical protein